MTDTQPSTRTRNESTAWMLVFAAWLIASASALGALFFSEIMQLPPCSLCWYQRTLMFPLVVILPMGLFPFDQKVVRYALPLAVVGWLSPPFRCCWSPASFPRNSSPARRGFRARKP
jgi:disulfide bond formation protein DsbB